MNSTNLIEDLRLLSPPAHGGWLALAVAGVLVCSLFLVLRRARHSAADIAFQAAGPEPWKLAIADLERLAHLLNGEHSRRYAIQSTGILRRYIETRYSLRALRLATEEFLVLAKDSTALPSDHRGSLSRFLTMCDLLKFGHYLATPEELEALHAAAVGFVLASRPVPLGVARSEGTA
jgi:hypothetical protein